MARPAHGLEKSGFVVLDLASSSCSSRSASPAPRRASSPELFAPEFAPKQQLSKTPTAVPDTFGSSKPSGPLRVPKKATASRPSGGPSFAMTYQPHRSPTEETASARATVAEATSPTTTKPSERANEGAAWTENDLDLLRSAVDGTQVGGASGKDVKRCWRTIGDMLGREPYSCLIKYIQNLETGFTIVSKCECVCLSSSWQSTSSG